LSNKKKKDEKKRERRMKRRRETIVASRGSSRKRKLPERIRDQRERSGDDKKERERRMEKRRETSIASRSSNRERRLPERIRDRRDRNGDDERPRSATASTSETVEQTDWDRRETRLASVRSGISSLRTQADNVQERISDLDDRIGDLPNRISRVRRMNYSLMGHFEENQNSLANKWNSRGSTLRDDTGSRLDSIRWELQSLSRQLSMIGSNSDPSNLESLLSNLRMNISGVSNFVQGEINEFELSLRELDSELSTAENTVDLLSNHSFEWKMREHPVISIRAHHLDDDVHGVLSLTNQRFIFEGEKEVVLKRTFFIATEKKRVRETIINEPIGAVDSIEKGRVGFFKGSGLYVKFDPQTELKEAKFDTRGDEGDQLVRMFEYIDSGKAEEDLEAIHGEEKEGAGESMPVLCPVCGAPYTEEIFRGQTSVECKYCETAIHLDA
jgi:hypothetical protein